MKFLSLTQKDIYLIKALKGKKTFLADYRKIIKCRKIKFGFYFGLYIAIVGFIWYFITAFCSIYINTKSAVIKDSFASIGISLIYPFALYLIPTSLRIWALRAVDKNMKITYFFSNLLPIL